MKILVVGYTPQWKKRVFAALPDNIDVTIKGDRLAAVLTQENASVAFDLYIFGNNLLGDKDVAVHLLEEAHEVQDKTPTIVFSEEICNSATKRITALGGILIRSDAPDADEVLRRTVLQLLSLSAEASL